MTRFGDDLRQPHPGTRVSYYRCSLPGLAGFAAYHCEGTDRGHHNDLKNFRWEHFIKTQFKIKQLSTNQLIFYRLYRQGFDKLFHA